MNASGAQSPNSNLTAEDRLANFLIKKGLIDKDKMKELLLKKEVQIQEGLKCTLTKLIIEDGILSRDQLNQYIQSNKSKTLIGGFNLIKKIGEGGMGSVYKAHQISMKRDVALKILPKTLSADKIFVKRFFSGSSCSGPPESPQHCQCL